jgi:hypothetical protein
MMILTIKKLSLILAYIAALLATISFFPQVYFDHVIYIVFGDDLQVFIKYNLPNWPYYLFPLLIIVSTIIKKTNYLLLMVFFLPYVVRNQVQYIIHDWHDPTIISMDHSLLFCYITIIMTILALISGFLSYFKTDAQ